MIAAWWGAGGAVMLALAAGLGERRRGRRADLDRVGWVDWPAVQLFAMIAAILLASIAFNA